MLFRTGVALLSLSCVLQGGLAALTPAQVVSNVQLLTTVSANIDVSLGILTTKTRPGDVRSIGQSVVSNFTVIITGLKNDITAMGATAPFADDVTGPIVNALTDFVRVHQILLSTVIGKHGIFAQFALTAPIAGILRTLEATIDSFAFSMIRLIPTRTNDVNKNKASLDDSVGKTITTYTQFCVPSILYPTVMPLCVG